MYGYITRDKDDLGMVSDVVVQNEQVRFVAKLPLMPGAYDLHLFSGGELSIRLLSSSAVVEHGAARFSCVAELQQKTVTYRRAPGPRRAPVAT